MSPDPFLAALEQAPEVRAARGRVLAARASIGAAGVLPEPRVSAEGTRMRSADGLEVWIEQELPRWGERDAAKSMARAEIDVARSELDVARAELAAEVGRLLADAKAARAREQIQADEAQRLGVLAEALTADVAGGGTRTQDVLALRTRIEAAEVLAADARKQALDAEDEVRAACGLDAGQTLPDELLPPLDRLDPAAFAPVRTAQARAQAAAAEVAQARSSRYPGVGVGAGWEREDLGGDENAWMGAVSVTIPVNRDAYDSSEKAARARADAARREADAKQLRGEVLFRRQQRASAQAAVAQRQAEDAIVRTEAQMDVLRAQLSAGEPGGLVSLFDRLDALAAAKLSAVDAKADAERARAELWRFVTFPDP